jgi:ABC-type transporter Mla MlaB component
MLRISVQTEGNVTALELEGKLSGPWVAELESCWRAAMAKAAGALIRVHLRAVSYIDAAGKELLAEMHRQGVELLASGCMTRAIVAEIKGKVLMSNHRGG